MLKYLLNLVLLGVVGYLCFMLYKTIEEPIKYQEAETIRKEASVEKLKLIRSAQIAYRNTNGKYAGDFDSLSNFIKTGDYMTLIKVGDPNDTTVQVRIDTSFVPIIDSLFKGNTASVDSLMSAPYTGGKKFIIEAGTVEKNEIEIPAFEAKIKYGDLYGGLVQKYYANIKDKFLQVGSMADATTNGTWE